MISADSHSAALFRQTAQTMLQGAGVVGAGTGSLQVTANSPANMSVNVAAGMLWIPGTLGATGGMSTNVSAQTAYGLPSGFTAQGSYCAYNDGTANLTIAAADPSNPRIDIVCASIQDAQYAGSNNTPVMQVITGTPAPSPSAPAAPASSVVLAQVAVAAGATSITSGNITDARVYAATAKPPAVAARVTITGSFSLANGTWVQIGNTAGFTVDYDPYELWNAPDNVFFLNNYPGLWRVHGRLVFPSNATGYRGVGFAWSSTTVDPERETYLPAGGIMAMEANSSGQVSAGNPNQYVRLMGYQSQTGGGAMSLQAQGEFSVEWLGPLA